MEPMRRGGIAVSIAIEVNASPELRALLESIELHLAHLRQELRQGLRHMANELDTVIADLNANTNAVATRIDNLVAALSNVATPEQLAELGAISSHLKNLGSDPSNPVPAATPSVSQRAAPIAPATTTAPMPAVTDPTTDPSKPAA